MQDLKDLKRFFLPRAIAGDRPPRYGPGRGSVWQKNSASKENSNVIYWFMSEYFMGYLLKCYWFFMLGSPIS